MASLYVKSKGPWPQRLSFKNLKKEAQNLNITLKNTGTRHVLFKSYNVILSDGKEKVELNMSDKAYETLGGMNILTGDVRRVLIPIPTKLKGEKFSVDFKLRELN